MVALSFYFEVHQPFRISDFRIQHIGSHKNYFNDASNKAIFEKVAKNCYWPAGLLIASLLKRHSNKFKVTFSITGTFLEQCSLYAPKLLELYQDILSLPNTEILCETSHHSLAALFDEDEFFKQIETQKNLIKKIFNREMTAFRNTELIYSNAIGKMVAKAGFHTCLVEGWEPYLPNGWNSHHIFHHPEIPSLKLFPKSYKLSDDIAFRFSNKMWPSWPLTAEKYHFWLESLLDGNHECIGLFMDYETFGEHQWRDTGIFEFLDHFVDKIANDDRFEFLTISDAVNKFPPRAPMDVSRPLSWADTERDLSAWLGNRIQYDAIEKVYKLKSNIELLNDMRLTEEWRKLLTSDHFYYMCIKWANDGDVHKYFSPFDSPYEAYLNFVNIIEDLEMKCAEKLQVKTIGLEQSADEGNVSLGGKQECQKTTQVSRRQKTSWHALEKTLS
jgi:alpha-amylase